MSVLVEVQKRVPPTSTTTRSTSRRTGAVVSSVAGDPDAARLVEVSSVAGDPDAARLRDIEHESAIRCVGGCVRAERVLGASSGRC